MPHTTTFQHASEQYEIRTISVENRTYVRVFKSGQPANGYEYSVDTVTQADATSSGKDLVKGLIETAESDVRNGVWDQYVAATSDRFEVQVDYHPSGRRTLKQKPNGHGSWADLPGALFGNMDRAAFYEAAFKHVAGLIQHGKVVVSLSDTSP